MTGFRVGQGFDVHRLAPGRPLLLGGVHVPCDRGLEGHSDGDCLLHALCDALLGAAGAGDMGQHFPSSDERWRGARSLDFVQRVVEIVREAGFAVENVDATVVAQAPRLAPHAAAMRASVARALAVDEAAVSIKIKSADHLGALGREEGIGALAAVLLRPRAGGEAT